MEFINIKDLISGTKDLSIINEEFSERIDFEKVALNKLNPEITASDENLWKWVQESFISSSEILNLNNGGVSPQPKIIQDVFDFYNRFCNLCPSHFMWQLLDQNREPLRTRLAELAGCSRDEVAITRNTTESINNIIFGMDLKKDDEVILSKQDYPNVIYSWKFREKRDGIVLRWVDLNLPSENDEEIIEKYSNEFSDKTKLINLTHMINWTGQILPVKKIIAKAHEHGSEVLLDAAHTFAQIVYNVKDIDCDYLATSLHKWLCAPFGTGMLFIKKKKIKNILPLFPNENPFSDDIKKFESMGTRSFPAEMATNTAIDFHYAIGPEQKEARLRYLKNFWAEKVTGFERVKMLTSLKPQYSCALGIFSVEGIKPDVITNLLFDKYRIHTTPIEWENISGIRITPHIYTKISDLSRFVESLEEILKSLH